MLPFRVVALRPQRPSFLGPFLRPYLMGVTRKIFEQRLQLVQLGNRSIYWMRNVGFFRHAVAISNRDRGVLNARRSRIRTVVRNCRRGATISELRNHPNNPLRPLLKPYFA